MGDRSAHSESGEPRLLARTRLRRPPAMEEGDGGQVEFGSVPGEGRAGQTECIFLLFGRYGEKEVG